MQCLWISRKAWRQDSSTISPSRSKSTNSWMRSMGRWHLRKKTLKAQIRHYNSHDKFIGHSSRQSPNRRQSARQCPSARAAATWCRLRFHHVHVGSGEVCALHGKNGYDLILVDIEMPGMDGFQVME